MTELLKKYYHIMDMYKKGEFGTEHLSLAEILEKAGEPDLIDRMNQSEIQHLIDNSTGLKKHMFIELKSKLKENSDVNKKQKFDVLAVPCNRAFVVAKEKTEAFKNSKPNLETRNNGLAVLTPAPKEGYLPSEQEMEILRSRKKPRKNSENTISDVNIFLTKEDHEQIAEKVIYSILRNEEEKTESEKSKELIEGLNKAKTELLEINEQDPEKARELAEEALIRTGVIKASEITNKGNNILFEDFPSLNINEEVRNEIKKNDKKVSFDLVFGGFKQREIEPLNTVVQKRKKLNFDKK